jgi:hypothetical protein
MVILALLVTPGIQVLLEILAAQEMLLLFLARLLFQAA